MKRYFGILMMVIVASSSLVFAISKRPLIQSQCFEFTPTEASGPISKVMIRFPLNSKPWRIVNFQIQPKSGALDEGSVRCGFESDLNFRCVRDDGGGEMSVNLREPAKMNVAYWMVGDESTENPLELPKDFVGRQTACAKKRR